jgi:formyl-CoA transferase
VVDSAIYEAVLAMMESLIPEYTVAGYTRERTGAILPNVAPSNVYPTADGQMILVAANQDTVFRRLAAVMGQPELADDPRYATHSARGANQPELDALIGGWTVSVDAAPLLAALEEAGVPTGRIYRAADMLADPHFEARGDIVHLPHPDFGQIAMQNVAPRLSATPGRVGWAGPALGQHNDEVYQGILGLTVGEVEQLRKKGVI